MSEKVRLSRAIAEFDLSLIGETAEKTRKWYMSLLYQFLEQFEEDPFVDEITATDLRLWRKKLVNRTIKFDSEKSVRRVVHEKLSPSTITGHVRAIKRLFGWMVREEMIRKNPASLLKHNRIPNQPPKAISESDFHLMLLGIQKYSRPKTLARNLAIFLFVADTGCRIGGLCTLKLEYLDLNKREAVVVEKGEKYRSVFFGEKCAYALKKWLEIRPDCNHDYVFASYYSPHRQMKPSSLSTLFKNWADQGGTKGRCSPHSLRHAAARDWLLSGVNLSIVSQLLGHYGTEVTAHYYARWYVTELREAHHKTANLDKKLDGFDLEEVLAEI